jgi:hypothetical protein
MIEPNGKEKLADFTNLKEEQKRYLFALAEKGRMALAAKAAGVDIGTVQGWLLKDGEFRKGREIAASIFADELIGEFTEKVRKGRIEKMADAVGHMFLIKQLDSSFKDSVKVDVSSSAKGMESALKYVKGVGSKEEEKEEEKAER